MYQDFSAAADPTEGAKRTRALMAELKRSDLGAFLVPRADEHMGEYVPACAERLKWLTAFSGSAGMAAVTQRKAALFVDGRYTLQAAQQADTRLFDIHEIPGASAADWLASVLPSGSAIGFDPWLHTTGWVNATTAMLARHGLSLKPVASNPIDKLWGKDRPAPPLGPVTIQPLEWAGESAETKIQNLQKTLKAEKQDATILTLPDSIAWLLNIRGSDVKHNPTALAFAIVPATGKPDLFIAKEKLGAEVRKHLSDLVRVRPPGDLKARLQDLKAQSRRVRLDETTAAHWFRRTLGERSRHIVHGSDLCIAPKAIKNRAEIEGSRLAHARDAIAMARYLAWLDRQAPSGSVTEILAVETLEEMRRDTQALKEISFDTISGAGPNGAIVHYRVTEGTNRALKKGELYLVDSGAQYQEGTTDITRTIAVGRPTAEMKQRFTLVLKGHISLATLRFPKGTTGTQIDAFARRALWDAGLDFDHGTGHGVGSYLSVHEGPQSISKRGHIALEPGMIISNEPGYYKTGEYGIRIENLVLV
ncbi:MAG: M24B family metallopeptidase, partial [Hyphomicrobiaceae bacterium]